MKLLSFYITVALILALNFDQNNAAKVTTRNTFKISTIQQLIKQENWSCVDVVEYFLRRSNEYNPMLKAIISYNPNAIAEAVRLDEYYAANKTFIGKLHCIPILVKDNIDVKSIPSTAGCRALRYSIPNKDAVVISRLRKEGAIFISKANLAELAIAFYNSSAGGPCKNPWDLTRSCGSSSSGSGAGMAAEFATIALGTDTGGSIIEPATFNGVFGFRPPHNPASLVGIVPGISKQDTVGPLTKSMYELVLTHSIMTDNMNLFRDFQTRKSASLANIRLGVIKELNQKFEAPGFKYNLDDEVKDAFEDGLKRLKKLGVQIVNVDISLDDFQKLGYFAVMGSMKNNECGAVCQKFSYDAYLKDPERFGPDAPYKNHHELFNSPLMPEYFVKTYGNIDLKSAQSCDDFDQCKEYMQFRSGIKEYVDAWLAKYQLNGLTFPSVVNLAFVLNDDFDIPPEVSPTFFAPFTGYSSLNIPIGLSKPQKSAPKGVPMGLNILATSDNVINSFLVANKYEENYLRPNMRLLPKSTPVVGLEEDLN